MNKVGSALSQAANDTKEDETGGEEEQAEDEGRSSSVIPAIILITSCVALAVVLIAGMVRGRKRQDAHNSGFSSTDPPLDIQEGEMIEMPIR